MEATDALHQGLACITRLANKPDVADLSQSHAAKNCAAQQVVVFVAFHVPLTRCQMNAPGISRCQYQKHKTLKLFFNPPS